jgi:hypothetical protein
MDRHMHMHDPTCMPRHPSTLARRALSAHRCAAVCVCVCVWLAQTEGEANSLKFSQVFHLMPVANSFVVTNGACVRTCCVRCMCCVCQTPPLQLHAQAACACRMLAPHQAPVPTPCRTAHACLLLLHHLLLPASADMFRLNYG